MTRTFATLVLPAALLAGLVATAGCKKAPDAPDGDIPGEVGLFGSFIAEEEILRPIMQPMIDEGVEYIDSGETDCYRIADLSPCDAMSMCIEGIDPTGVPAVVHSEVLDYPVFDVERALMHDDWTELYPSNYTEWSIAAEDGREEYLAGETHFFWLQYQGTIDVIGMEAAMVTNLQFRRIDDWDGAGNPLVIIRGYFPQMPVTSSDNLNMTMNFSWEIMEPIEGGTKTRRLFANWTDLTIGSLSTDDAFNIACGQSKSGWDDIDEWLQENPS
jgi:hypothetical protein